MNAGGCASGDGIVPIPCDFNVFSSGRFGALNANTESVGARQITAGPEPATGFPQEVIMTIAIYDTTVEPAIAPPQSADSIQLTELVRGVTFGTGNCILKTIFVSNDVNQSRAALSDVWMTRTRSA
jgi:hypothetical protein